MRWSVGFVGFLLAFSGCQGGQSAYCVDTIDEANFDDFVNGVIDDPAYAGAEVCVGSLSWGYCKDIGGEPVSVEADDDGTPSWCSGQGFGVVCGDANVFVRTAEDCPTGATDTGAL